MSMIRITPFSGIIPKQGNRLLSNANATVANNIKLISGEIRPLNGLYTVSKPTKTLPAQSIYLARNKLDAQAWFTWPTDIDVVRAPLSADVDSRFYWTGEGAPKYSTYNLSVQSGTNNYPSFAYDLGIPPPPTKLTVGFTGGVGVAVSRFYVQTFFSALGEESAPSPVSDLITGKVDSSWAISNLNELPVSSGTVTGVLASGITTFTDTVRHWLRVGDAIVIAGVNLTVLGVTSPFIFTVTGNYSAATTWARKNAWNAIGMKRRLYRTAGNNAVFQLVADDVGASYTDTLTDSQILGDELISLGWVPPPIGLTNITVHPSGALIGLSGNQLCFSEPYQPHAWPTAYQISTDYEGVGLGVFGSDIGVGTKGNPYIVSGVDPSTMTAQKIEGMYPCLSKRSIISVGQGFMYATTHGYVSVGSNGVEVFSDQFFTKDEWRKLNPGTMIASAAYGRIYLSYVLAGNKKSMLIMEQDMLINCDLDATDIYTDVATGDLYISDINGINEWDSDRAFKLNGNWRSKDFILPAPVNYGAAKIDFELAISAADLLILQTERQRVIDLNSGLLSLGKAFGSINAKAYNSGAINKSNFTQVPDVPPSNSITFIVRKDNEVVISRVVNSTKAFRLPAGYKSDVFSLEVLTQCSIKEIRIAETMNTLRLA